MKLKLGLVEKEFVPMTHGTSKKVFGVVVDALAKKAEIRDVAIDFMRATLSGSDEASLNVLSSLVKQFPDVLDDILVLGLGVTKEDIEGATPGEVLTAVEVFVDENDLVNIWERAKKVYAQFVPAPKLGQPAGPAKAGS